MKIYIVTKTKFNHANFSETTEVADVFFTDIEEAHHFILREISDLIAEGYEYENDINVNNFPIEILYDGSRRVIFDYFSFFIKTLEEWT